MIKKGIRKLVVHLARLGRPTTTFTDNSCIRREANEGNPEEEIVRALKLAHIWEVVQGLTMQERTPIGADYGALSSGQKQRGLIARVLAKNSDILFFDEGTNNLDKGTEELIAESLISLANTVICITHNPRAYRDFDQFLWVENGGVEAISYASLEKKLHNH